MKKITKLLCVCLSFMTLVSCGGSSGSSTSSTNSDASSNSQATGATNVTLDFYAVNDLHGKFSDTAAQPGVDELSTYLNAARQNNPNTVVFSSGDVWQGTAESGLTDGLLLTEWMNELDFVSMTMGNHEYDWGETVIEANAAIAEFPFLACNIFDSLTNQLVDYCQPSVLVETADAQIGIIGAIGDCYSSIASDYSKGVYFKVGDELTELVKEESVKLRNAGADFIVYSLHDGYGRSYNGVSNISDNKLASYYDIELSDGYVDLVFEGHTHQHYVLKDSKGVYHLQGGGDNDGITHAKVVLNVHDNTYKVNNAEYLPTSAYSHLEDDPVVAELSAKYEEEVTKANSIVGTNGQYRSSDFLCDLVAQLYAQKGEELWGNYDIVLGGGFLSARDPYSLYAGQVAYSDLYSVFPFNNQLVLCSIKGSYLKSKFINSTNSKYHIGYTAYGESIKDSIVDTQIYYVVVDTYTSTYGPNRLTEIERYAPKYYARDLLADYIKAGGLA